MNDKYSSLMAKQALCDMVNQFAYNAKRIIESPRCTTADFPLSNRRLLRLKRWAHSLLRTDGFRGRSFGGYGMK